MSIGFRVVTEIQRPPTAVINAFRDKRSCDLSDVMNRAGTMYGIEPLNRPVARIVGPAVTVSAPTGGINILKLGMQQTRPGDVLVVNVPGSTHVAMWGGNVSIGMKARGVAGTIIDGAARDRTEINQIDYPVWARRTAIASASATEPRGEVNVPIACGGTVVSPGDIVVADDDGIVVVPPAIADEVLRLVVDLENFFASLRPALDAGEVTNIENITKQAIELGCVFE
jgi:4-hydroxy-4-methyl-2-oxoglutarate aldolase